MNPDIRHNAIKLILEAVQSGARREKACELLDLISPLVAASAG